jgi:IclR family pca regulon transcriptional regulator
VNDEKLYPGHRDYVGTLASGLEVIGAFDAQHKKMTLTEVAEQTGMDRAKARRFLLTLNSLGYIQKDGRQFMLTPKVLQLGYAYTATNNHLDVVKHYLEEITTKLGESCSLAVLDNQEIVYQVRSSAAHRLMSIHLTPGTRLPAAYTSMGRVLITQLAESEQQQWIESVTLNSHTANSIVEKSKFIDMLKEVKHQGYCIVDQELELGLRSLAIPLFNYHGKLMGAINISTNALRVSLTQLIEDYLTDLQEASKKIIEHTR